jgi:hypothetical protein
MLGFCEHGNELSSSRSMELVYRSSISLQHYLTADMPVNLFRVKTVYTVSVLFREIYL